ncbi:MAG TPA: response regulator transcription factor [Chitinophagaceae bacterium]|jgi:DNA-binding LytR/AlgR family response regulator
MLNCIAIDDEPLALQLLADNISKVPYLNLVASCGDAFEATRILQDNAVDLLFVDIQMPGLTGLQFIESLAKKPMVILITAYKQYALEGYGLDVVDYLVKPVALDRFIKACNKAQELHLLKTAGARSPNSPAPEYMFVNIGYSLLKVIFSDIEWIEGLKDYLQIHLKSTPKPVIVRMSFKAIEEQLPPTAFVRIHKSYIVSVNSITAIRKSSVFVREHEFPVGETYREVIDKLAKGN